MTLQQTAIVANIKAKFAVAGIECGYRRATDITTPLLAVVSNTTREIDTEFGIITKDIRTYEFKQADIPEPQAGDIVSQTIGITVYAYEVFAPDGKDCYYHVDENKQYVKVFTQRVETEEYPPNCEVDTCNVDSCEEDACGVDVCKEDACEVDQCTVDVCTVDSCEVDECGTDVCGEDTLVCGEDEPTP